MTPQQISILKKIREKVGAAKGLNPSDSSLLIYSLGLLDALLENEKPK